MGSFPTEYARVKTPVNRAQLESTRKEASGADSVESIARGALSAAASAGGKARTDEPP